MPVVSVRARARIAALSMTISSMMLEDDAAATGEKLFPTSQQRSREK